MTDTSNLGLPCIEAAQAQKHVTHNEALRILDTLVQLAVLDRDLNAPPGSPTEGQRWIVKASPSPTGAWAGHGNEIAAWQDGGWQFSVPRIGWLAYVVDEGTMLAWDGDSWEAALDVVGGVSELQNITLLGVGTTADTTNPFSAKLNNALWVAKTVAEGGDGDLRYKLSKESASKTLSYLFQDNFSGRAEIGLTGDDDFHFKTSADGSTWVDALILDKTTGATKINTGFFLPGDLSPSQITADQNDYNPSGLASATVLRISSDASRNITGLSGGGDGRIVAIVNVGANNIVLKDASTSSSAGNRFSFGADVTLAGKQSAVLWYDAIDGRWKLLAAPQAAGGGGSVPADLDILLAELALGIADNANVAQFLGSSGNRVADSFDALTYVDTGGASNLDSGTAGLLKPTQSSTTQTINSASTTFDFSTGYTNIDRSTALTNGDVITKIGTYSTSAFTFTVKIVKRNSAGNFDVAVSESFSHPGGGWSDKTLSSPYTITAANAYYCGAYVSGVRDVTGSVARAYKAGDVTGSGQSGFTEDSGNAVPFRVVKNPTTNNMTVASTAFTAASAPSSAKLVAHAKFIDSITLGSDLTFEVSRDNGTTFTAASMNDRFTANSLHVLESAAVDVTGQPAGTSVKWRIKTFNNKSAEIHDLYVYWT